jgi:general secretion pathway protein D
MRTGVQGITVSVLVALIVITLAGLPAFAKKTSPPAGSSFTVEFRDCEIREFLARMSVILGMNIISDERVTGRISIFPARRVRVSEALSFLTSVLEYRGYAVVDCGEFLKVLPIDEAARKHSTIIIDLSR